MLLSGMPRRPTTAMPPGMMARMKGTLQAQSSTPRLPKSVSIKKHMNCAERKPTEAVEFMREEHRLRVLGDATSAKYEDMVPTSPAALMPWMKRRQMSSTSPKFPSQGVPQSRVGSNPCPQVPSSMPMMEMLIDMLRPYLSPIQPRIIPPKGLAKNVTLKPSQTPKEEPEKKCFSKWGARYPYTANSYHSTMLPSRSDQYIRKTWHSSCRALIFEDEDIPTKNTQKKNG
mmetsp:Transcript_40626/g.87224  ORF Transcript_40626/g.87224 Transcript_40626/m.87224 type:complete len:229 (+) Transcript_40626:1195-1881(+)